MNYQKIQKYSPNKIIIELFNKSIYIDFSCIEYIEDDIDNNGPIFYVNNYPIYAALFDKKYGDEYIIDEHTLAVLEFNEKNFNDIPNIIDRCLILR